MVTVERRTDTFCRRRHWNASLRSRLLRHESLKDWKGIVLIVSAVLCLSLWINRTVNGGDQEDEAAIRLLYDSYRNNLTVNRTNLFVMDPVRVHRDKSNESLRILYVVTSSSKHLSNWWGSGMEHFDTSSRWEELILPVLVDSVLSMVQEGRHKVDLYLVLGYTLTESEYSLLRRRLPSSVGLEVWQDATPIGYEQDATTDRYVEPLARSLSRQHRFVVRDKLLQYDMFCCFEDDMIITAEHIRYYLNMTDRIERWRRDAPVVASTERIGGMSSQHAYFGAMTKEQLRYVRPGFLRVETFLDEFWYPAQSDSGPVPLSSGADNNTIDASICCNTSLPNLGLLRSSSSYSSLSERGPVGNRLMLWETAAEGVALREMPDGRWYALLPGPYRQKPSARIGKIETRSLEPKLPQQISAVDPNFLAQSAGWMMTFRQVVELHTDLCPFLPPYDTLREDGLRKHNVEFWSGGLQLWCGRDGCNIQRIVALDGSDFSKHLLLHAANNKQKTIQRQRRVRAMDYLSQLQTLRERAMGKKQELVDGHGGKVHR